MDTSIIVALITGGCAISSLIVQKILKVNCDSNVIEENQNNNSSCNCFISNKCFKKKIPNEPRPIKVLNKVFEPPFNGYTINANNINRNMNYCKILSDNSYLIDIPPRINLINNGRIVENGNVNVFKEFKEQKPETGNYFLEVELNNITENKVRLFIKRFDKNYSYVGLSEYKYANEGLNNFKTESKIGTNNIYYEQVGVQVFCNEKEIEGNSICIISKVYLNNKPLTGCYLF